MTVSRRELLRRAGGLLPLSLLGRPALAEVLRQPPDLILHNGDFLTMDARQPRAGAIAIAGERIVAVGADVDVLEFGAAGSRKIDLDGRTAVPGFIDAHCAGASGSPTTVISTTHCAAPSAPLPLPCRN